ncbi:bacterial type II secretion system protein F domain protein [mine drainage metagenome]|uniref:Bacterial type II secretion system protein F domain protein n=1 Tax=mine drainage metagenome TaxID=410659 RepID=A0A1J5QDI5_9ZZZZ
MREAGIVLLTIPFLAVVLYWLSHQEKSSWSFGNPYSILGRALSPARLRLDQSVASRIARMGVSAPITQGQYRREQLRWTSIASVIGALVVIWLHPSPVRSLLLLIMSALAGAVVRDRQLTIEVRRHETRIATNFPQVAELLALAVSAGESPVAALDRLVTRGDGPLIAEFDSAINLMKAGVPLVVALDEIARTSGVAALRRFIDGVVVTLERGTPIAETLRMQANDVREERRRALLEASGRAEIAMMIPIVFLIMPITVLFALWPSITTLSSMTY